MMRKLALGLVTLIVSLNIRATTLTDNLSSTTFATEQVMGSTWITAGFQTGSSNYLLNSATFLMLGDSQGSLSVGLYSTIPMQPANSLGSQPGLLLGNLTATSAMPSKLAPVTFSGNNLMLKADTTYWLVMSAPSSGSYEWAYEAGETGSGSGFFPSWGFSSDSGSTWFTDNLQPMQMSVIGTPTSSTTPEPSAAWLVVLGLAAVTGAVLGSPRRVISPLQE